MATKKRKYYPTWTEVKVIWTDAYEGEYHDIERYKTYKPSLRVDYGVIVLDNEDCTIIAGTDDRDCVSAGGGEDNVIDNITVIPSGMVVDVIEMVTKNGE